MQSIVEQSTTVNPAASVNWTGAPVAADPRPIFQQKAIATRQRRLAAGKYPSRAQRAAFKRFAAAGKSGLTVEELQLMATHPHLLPRQRAEFAALAEQASKPVLDDSWIVAIVAEIEALPETLADVTDPYQVGWLDAEKGEVCEPTAHYARLGDIEMYIIGWKDAAEAMERACASPAS